MQWHQRICLPVAPVSAYDPKRTLTLLNSPIGINKVTCIPRGVLLDGQNAYHTRRKKSVAHAKSASSLRFYVGGLDNLGPLADFVGNKLDKIAGR
jgi:hypothetical protein